MRLARVVPLLCSAGIGSAMACGVCIEDKVAATYDHAVVTRAVAAGRVVVFAEPRANVEAATLARKLSAAAARTRGVDPVSVRTSQAPASLAFALDPKAATPSTALAAISKSAGVARLELVELRVIR
jgi:hypothetical protein